VKKKMFYITKELEISASHSLDLPYESKCKNIHGHNWKIKVFCKSSELNSSGMVVDFTEIKARIHGVLDHQNLNEVFAFNPTAENIAHWIYKQIDLCYKVEVQESTGNIATFEELEI